MGKAMTPATDPERPAVDPAEDAFATFHGRYWEEAYRFFAQYLYREQDRRNAEDCAQEAFLKLARRYRDDTATVRAAVGHERTTGRMATGAELAATLGCDARQAEERARRCVESGWLNAATIAGGVVYGGAQLYPTGPVILSLAPLEAMRWTTYRNVLADYGRQGLARQNALIGDLDRLVERGMEPFDTRPNPEQGQLEAELHREIATCLAGLSRAERTVLILHYFHGLHFPEIAALPWIARLTYPDSVAAQKSAAQIQQRLKDLAKAGRRRMQRSCAHLAVFLGHIDLRTIRRRRQYNVGLGGGTDER